MIRHAKADPARAGGMDFDRPLNARGKADANDIGRQLAQEGPCPDVCLSSPAVRAWTTAQIVLGQMGLPEESLSAADELYGAEAGDILNVIRNLDDRHTHALLVGHNPGMLDLAAALADQPVNALPAGGAVTMTLSVDTWRRVGSGDGRRTRLIVPNEAPR